ncbi:MAG: hypothetical protein NTX59_08350 [Elusimicrobia bacterium]|nr:hypothetical protein [Elusimicrobiota bacterium]
MDPIPPQILVAHIHRTGIESALRRLKAEGKDHKDALYEIIEAAKEADCAALFAAACSMYEVSPD